MTDSGWRKRQIALDAKADNARELGLDYEVHSCSYYCDRPECIKAQRDELRDKLAALTLKHEQTNAELTAVYGLLGMAHLNIKQHLKYGFNEKTAQSTLISVGRYYPRLKTEMEKNNE